LSICVLLTHLFNFWPDLSFKIPSLLLHVNDVIDHIGNLSMHVKSK